MSDLDTHLPNIAAGDPDAFARWVAGAEFRVRASLTSVSGSVDVESVVQETLLRIWQVAPRVEPDGKPNSLLRLAIRIARNLAVSDLRRRRVRPEVLARLESHTIDERVEAITPDPMLREAIAVCREQLPGKPSMALDARLTGPGTPDKTLATRVGMKLNTFLQNVTRARKLLAECLKRAGIDLETELA